jgi:hypothetical protein
MTSSPKYLWLAEAISTYVCSLKAARLEEKEESALREKLNITRDKQETLKK